MTGGSGNVGGKLLGLLARQGAPVRVLARDPARVRPDGIEIVRGDLTDPASLVRALRGVDRAFLVSPFVSDQVELETNFIDAATRVGGVHVVKIGALGAAADADVGFLRRHGQIAERLRASGLPWTVLDPNSFMQNLLWSAETISRDGVFFDCTSDDKLSAVDTRDVAAVAAAVLTTPGHEGRTYVVTGPEALSRGEMASQLSATVGQQVRYVAHGPAEHQRYLQTGTHPLTTGQGITLPAPSAHDVARYYGVVLRGGFGANVTSVVADLTRRPPTTFAQWAHDYAAAFRP